MYEFHLVIATLNIYAAKKPWKCFLSTLITFEKPLDPQKIFTLNPEKT